MDLGLPTTAGLYLALFAVLGVGTYTSPMTTSTVVMVLGGLPVFGPVTLALGVKHGEYRAPN